MNKKGTSLVELIISIALISVILVFMIKLLLDINNNINNSDFAKNNQITRAEIIRLIENDIKEKTIKSINDSGSNSNKLVITLTFSDGSTSVIEATKSTVDEASTFSYKATNENTRKWTFAEGANIYVDRVNTYYSPNDFSDLYTMSIVIEVHTINDKNNKDKNNNMDDIIISYIGKTSDLNTSIAKCLGYSKNTCQD